MALKNAYNKLNFIAKIKNPQLRSRLLLTVADDQLYNALHEIAVNYNRGNIKLKSNQKRQISKFKNLLKRLATKPKSKAIKRKLIKQSGGFLPFILPLIANLIPSVIDAIKN